MTLALTTNPGNAVLGVGIGSITVDPSPAAGSGYRRAAGRHDHRRRRHRRNGGRRTGYGATADQVVAINITNPGSGYTSAPQVMITGGGGTGAVGDGGAGRRP